MNSLEQLIKKEYKEHKSERLFIFYSVSISPPTKPSEPAPSEPSISFDSLSAYADSLNKQYGVPSPSVKPEAPSPPVSLETFNPAEVMQAISKPYKSILSEEETAYATILSKQANVPSSIIEPVRIPSNPADPKTFDLGQAIIAINDFTHSSISSNFITPSSAKPAEESIYNPHEFKTPEIVTPKFEPINIPYYKGGISSKDEIFHSKPYKYLDSFSKNEVKIITEDNYTKSDFHNVLTMFKNNDLPNVYEKIKQNLHMRPKSVTAIKLTNPLYTESIEEEGPVFVGDTKEIRLPITQPKFIPFIKTDKQKYRDIVLNSFLPHEQAHANINKKYGHMGENEGLIGFNEHLANTMAKDSLGQSYVKAETEYQNMWAGSSETKSYMEENYNYYLKSKRIASDVPANVATINILGNPLLKKKTDNILQNSLERLYPDDERFRENVLKDIYGLSKIYQTEALKITELSKKDTILSNFKVKRALSEVEKYTFRFTDELK